jgi:hypothetical protein
MQDRPIRDEAWKHYEIVLKVDDDAETVVCGMFISGKGKAWFSEDHYRLQPIPNQWPHAVGKDLGEFVSNECFVGVHRGFAAVHRFSWFGRSSRSSASDLASDRFTRRVGYYWSNDQYHHAQFLLRRAGQALFEPLVGHGILNRITSIRRLHGPCMLTDRFSFALQSVIHSYLTRQRGDALLIVKQLVS